VNTTAWAVGSAEVVRIVDVEITLPPELLTIGDSADDQAATIAAAPWAVPRFATEANEVRFAFAAIGIASEGTRIVVDPALGFDEGRAFPDAADRLAAFEAALTGAGFDPASVDVVLNTHSEGVGWNARLDLTGEVSLEGTPGHTPGAMLVRVRSGGDELVVVGDLFIHPLQLAAPTWVGNDALPAETIAVRRRLLDDCAARDVPIVSPHFPEPGGGRVRVDGTDGRWALVT
jgi:glyoxylase-like metal-dependent hydrolase (beta-lactamase superfamily II)